MKAMLALGSLLAINFAWADQTNNPAPQPSGDAVASSSISERTVASEHSQKAADEIRVQYPEISRDILTLFTIDKVVLTSNGTLDLYAGQTLWMTLEKHGQVFEVRDTLYTFAPTSIEHTMSVDKPDLVNGLDFIFKGCTPASQNQAQACEMVRVHLTLAEIVPQ